jgi:hypothetical protein
LLQRCPELMDRRLMPRYYPAEVLASAAAREGFVLCARDVLPGAPARAASEEVPA